VDLDLIKRTLPHGRHQFYICGPAPMMESLVPALAAWGVALEDIHFEAFGPASIRSVSKSSGHFQPLDPGADLQSFEVQFLRSGRTLSWTADSGTLLELAEKNGIPMESGCRAGSCGACETKLMSGNVRYPDKPDYNIATGSCLVCVGMPSNNVVLAA
jgi:ferredoxin